MIISYSLLSPKQPFALVMVCWAHPESIILVTKTHGRVSENYRVVNSSFCKQNLYIIVQVDLKLCQEEKPYSHLPKK